MEEKKYSIKEYCDKLYEWAAIIKSTYAEIETQIKNGELEPKQVIYPQVKELPEALDIVMLAIQKSSLLGRTMYGGQKPRTKKCPVHQGRWSGLYATRPDHHARGTDLVCECWDGWECSGWVPEHKDLTEPIQNDSI